SPGVDNIKNYVNWTSASVSGGYYQSVFNVHHTSSAAVELCQVAYGQSISSAYYANAAATNKDEKNRIYRLFAKHLLGDEDSLFSIDGTTRNDLIFLSMKRNQFKDEIKKGTVALEFTFSGSGDQSASVSFNTAIHTDVDAV